MCEIVVYVDAERKVVAQRFRSSFAEIALNWRKFAQEVYRQGIVPSGWGIAEYFSHGEFDPNDIDYELMLPVIDNILVKKPLTTRFLPSVKVASIIHRGAHEEIGKSYEILMNWIAENDLKPVGNAREHYLRCPHTTPVPEGYITEIQIPVA